MTDTWHFQPNGQILPLILQFTQQERHANQLLKIQISSHCLSFPKNNGFTESEQMFISDNYDR